MSDPLRCRIKGLGKKPTGVKKIRTGWCPFCDIAVPLKVTPRIGYLCPQCGGRVVGDHPGQVRHVYPGGFSQ
jgi:hypothetical protein